MNNTVIYRFSSRGQTFEMRFDTLGQALNVALASDEECSQVILSNTGDVVVNEEELRALREGIE